jgi:outer membrane receptor for ferrienterochelin and colicins
LNWFKPAAGRAPWAREKPNQVKAPAARGADAAELADPESAFNMSKRVTTAVLCLASAMAAPLRSQPIETAPVQTVVVTATRNPIALIDAPASMTVVTRAQIAERGADNVLDALRAETGVTLAGRTISGRKGISLRGMDGRHTLTLVDGKRIAPSDGVVGHSDFQYDWIPVEAIERIEVIRGPMSVLYGSEALGGVINVILRPMGESWAFSALLEGRHADGERGGDGQRAALRVAGPLGEHWRLGVTASDVRREAVDSEADARISDLEGRRKRDALVQLAWLPADGQQVQLEHWAGREDRWAGARERGGKRRFHETLHDIERAHTSLGWAADWGGERELRSLLRTYESSIDVTNTRTEGVAALRPQKIIARVLEGQASLLPVRNQLVTVGFEGRDETLYNEGLPGQRGDAEHRALYLQDEIRVNPALALTLGLRNDRQSAYGSEWSPRAYAVWRPAPQWTLKGGYGHGFMAPTLKQSSPGYREDEGPNTYFGNAEVQPETNDSVEVGVGWDAPQASAQLTLFQNRVNDLIVTRRFDTVAGRGYYVFDNIDSARLQGAEASTTLRFGGGVMAVLNYLYLDATDGNGNRLEKRPRHTLGARLDWVADPWAAGLVLSSTRDQVLASPVPGQPPQQVPAITLLGAHAQWRITPAVELGLGVDNLTDVRLSEKSPLFTYAEAPRTWRIALRGRW